MHHVPVMGWFDPITHNAYQASLAPNPDRPEQPHYASQLGVFMPQLNVQVLAQEVDDLLIKEGQNGLLPTRSNPTDAGLDLYAAEDVLVTRFKPEFNDETHRVLVSTGIAAEVPPGLALFIWDRSGLSVKHGLHRVAGVVDSSYRGIIKVALVNLTADDYMIHKGDRIAQAILSPVILPVVNRVSSLSSTDRGAGGFGSTGR